MNLHEKRNVNGVNAVILKMLFSGHMWWYMHVIPVIQRQTQEDTEFEASPGKR
jgi:hypothetical protein